MGIRTKTGWPDKYYSQELERCLAESDSYKEEQRSADDTDSNLGKEVRDFDSIGNRWRDWQSWGKRCCHYRRNSRDVRKSQKDDLPALRDIQKKKLSEENTKVKESFV